MTHTYSMEEEDIPMVREPDMEFGTVAKRACRVITDEEIARCIPLEESRRRLTEKIYRFYHPEA